MKKNARVLDMCCGGKHFWYDKNNKDVLKNYEYEIKEQSTPIKNHAVRIGGEL